jgi:DNA-binding NtrC family response regulator
MAKTGRLLIVDDEEVALRNLEHVMRRAGHSVTTASSGVEALAFLDAEDFDLLLTDLRMENVDGMQLLKACREKHPDAEVIMITGYATTESAVKAMKEGAFYYVAKPFRLDEVRQVVAEALEKIFLKRENQALREQLERVQGRVKIITQDARMQKLLEMVRQIGPTGCNVVITGESGTGKELFARYLHEHGGRPDGPFVAVNCGAFNEELLANELFGNEKGAFTGATGKLGLIETANGGTLFLDEVTEMSTAMQVKLLRVIQEREVLRLGGTQTTKVDVRFCAATNRDVPELVQAGRFRQDLYFRLNVVNIHIPPLSERSEDIPLLAYHFLNKYGGLMRKTVNEIAPTVLDLLQAYEFPGNVRELENIIERAVAICTGHVIEAEHLPSGVRELSLQPARRSEGQMPTLEEQGREYILQVLKETNGNQTLAAEILGINRVSLWRKLKRYNLEDT